MLTLNDGRSDLWQWDTGRTLAVDADCSQVHFSNKFFGRSIDVDVVDGAAVIPDVLLQTDKDLNVWAFVGTADNGYTKISKTFTVNRRNKPADYVFTPADQMTLQTIQRQIGDLADLTTEAKDTLVAAINEAARTGGGAGSMDLRVSGDYIQYSTDGGSTWTNIIAVADLKGAKGDKGEPGKDGITPTIGQNGNWYLGEEDTGKPSRGEQGTKGNTGDKGADGAPGKDGTSATHSWNGTILTITSASGTSSADLKGEKGDKGDKGDPGTKGDKGADGKSAYQYAQDGGYTGTEAEFAEKLASGALIVHVTGVDNNLTADKTYADIMDAILAGTTVFVDRGERYLPLVSINIEYPSLLFGTTTCVNDDTGKVVFGELIEITQNGEVKDGSALVDIPTTLPNPNALTFTGAVTGTYDGSAPLSVAIPSGGDAGKSVRHIATVAVTTGTTSYSVTVDSNGDALNLESVYILTEKFWGNNGSYVQVDVNGKVITKAFGQSGSPQVLELEKMGELQKFTNIPKPSDVGISFGNYYNGQSAVTSVGFWTATSNVDTTIEIYGVDA